MIFGTTDPNGRAPSSKKGLTHSRALCTSIQSMSILTCNLQGGFVTLDGALRVPGDAVVHATVLTLFGPPGAQEEETSVREKNPVGRRILRRRLHPDAVLEPRVFRFRMAAGRALQRDRFVPGHRHVVRVFGDGGDDGLGGRGDGQDQTWKMTLLVLLV